MIDLIDPQALGQAVVMVDMAVGIEADPLVAVVGMKAPPDVEKLKSGQSTEGTEMNRLITLASKSSGATDNSIQQNGTATDAGSSTLAVNAKEFVPSDKKRQMPGGKPALIIISGQLCGK